MSRFHISKTMILIALLVVIIFSVIMLPREVTGNCSYCCNLDFFYVYACDTAGQNRECVMYIINMISACCAISGYYPCADESIGTDTAAYQEASGSGRCVWACGNGSACGIDYAILDDPGECQTTPPTYYYQYDARECTGGSGNSCF